MLPSISSLLKSHALTAKRSLGQNFLIDENICAKIAGRAKISSEDTIVEVGPGVGSLTRAILECGPKKLILIEKDGRFLEILGMLQSHFPCTEIIIHHADALDASALLPNEKGIKLLSNLPYNVGTQLIINWILAPTIPFAHMTLMLQNEVVDRLTAMPNTKDYGRLSILVQWLCAAEKEFKVPATAFTPKPNVTSAIVTLTPRSAPLFPARTSHLTNLTQIVFQQRRKMLRKSLDKVAPDISRILESVGIDPTARPETLSIEDFCRLSTALFS